MFKRPVMQYVGGISESRRRAKSEISTAAFGMCWLFLLLALVLPTAAQEAQENDVFPVPDSYKIEGIPPIKKSEVDHLFYDPASIRSNLIWDADRQNRRLLVTDQTNNIYLLSSPLSQPIKLIEKVVPNSVKMRSDGQAFVYSSDRDDEDNFELFLYDVGKKISTKLTTLRGKDESIDSFIWSRTGDSLFYVRADYDLKTSALCHYDFQAEKCFKTELKGVWEVLDANGNQVLLKYWKASTSQHLYLLDASSDKLTPIDEKGNARKGGFAGDAVLWTTEGNDSCKRNPCVLSMNLKSKKIAQLDLPENLLTIHDTKIAPNGKHLLIQETRDGIDHLRVFRLKNGNSVKELSPFLPNSFVVWHTRWLSDNEIAYTIENIGKPASIQSYNIDSKVITDWTKEKLPPSLEGKVVSPEIIRWKSFDQREISGFIVRPKSSTRKLPVLIDVHGGPQILDKPLFNSQDIRLASNLGMAIIHTNIRGSSGFGNEFMNADNKEKRGDAVKDIRALLDWVEKQPDLDSNQVFLRGGSYGGFIVLSTALQEASRIKGVIAEYPLVSIRGMLGQSWIDELAKNEYGEPKDEKLMLALDELSPLNNVTRWNKIPLLLTRGKLDSRNPEKDVVDLKNQLRSHGTDVWFIYSTNDGHGFSGKYVFAAVYKFLKTKIKEN